MIVRGLCSLAILLITVSAGVEAQKSSADKQAGSWFNNGHDASLQRMPALQKEDVDWWEAAAKKAGIAVERSDVVFALPKFNPLFDAKNQVVAGAMAKYSKRLAQLPATAVQEWAALTGGEPLVVALSLTAESSVFPGERFSAAGFRALTAWFK